MSPCPTRVTSTVRKAQNSSRSRSGKGLPSSVTRGSVKIAARLITPRVPAQLRTTISRPESRPAAGLRSVRFAVAVEVLLGQPHVQRLGQVLGEPQPQRTQQQHDAQA